MSRHDRYGQHIYGSAQKELRARFAQRMTMGEVFYCWRPECRRRINPHPNAWDLGHVDPGHRAQFETRHPEYRKCNRTTFLRMLANARG
jgi:hypothetical protein